MTNYRKTLFELLNIAGYQKNKDQFIDKFTSLCFYKAIMDLLSELPEEEQKKLEKKVAFEDDPQKLIDYCEDRFGKEAFKIALKQNMKSCFLNVYSAVEPTLSDKQKKNLDTYISSFSA